MSDKAHRKKTLSINEESSGIKNINRGIKGKKQHLYHLNRSLLFDKRNRNTSVLERSITAKYQVTNFQVLTSD